MEIDFTYEKEQLLQFVKSKENDHKQEEGDIEGIVEQDEDEQEEDEQQEDEQQEGEAEGEQEEQVEPEGGAPVVFTSLTALFKVSRRLMPILYHFKTPNLLDKHICCGVTISRDVFSIAMSMPMDCWPGWISQSMVLLTEHQTCLAIRCHMQPLS